MAIASRQALPRLPGALSKKFSGLPGRLSPLRLSPLGLALAVLLHGAAFFLLMRLNVAANTPPTTALTVDIVTSAPRPKVTRTQPPAAPQPRPPMPQPAPRQLLATPPTATPGPVVSAPAPAAVESSPAPVAAAPQPAPPVSVATPAPTLAPPRFDADYLNNPKPPYPPMSRRLGEQGKVVLRVFVNAEGRPGEVLVQASSGSARLDQAAQQTVAQWRFSAARLGSDSVAAWVLVPIAFTLKE